MSSSSGDLLMTASSVGPAILLLWFFAAHHRFAAPPSRILAAFAVGALALLPLWALEALLLPVLGTDHRPAVKIAEDAFIVAGGCEELVKWLAVMAFCVRPAATVGAVDCLVYGAAVGLGFAAVENIHYVLHFPDHWRGVALARGLMAVPFHASLGALMGAAIAQATSTSNGAALSRRRLLWFGVAWLGPALLHGCYDLPTLWRDTLTHRPFSDVKSNLVMALSLTAVVILIVTVAAALLVAGRARRMAGVPAGPRGTALATSGAWGAVTAGGVVGIFAFAALLEIVAVDNGLQTPLLADKLAGIGVPHLIVALIAGLIVFECGAVWLNRMRRQVY